MPLRKPTNLRDLPPDLPRDGTDCHTRLKVVPVPSSQPIWDPDQAPSPDPTTACSLISQLEDRYLPAMEDDGDCIGAGRMQHSIFGMVWSIEGQLSSEAVDLPFPSKNLASHKASDEGLSKCFRQWCFSGSCFAWSDRALVRLVRNLRPALYTVLQGNHARHHFSAIGMLQLVSSTPPSGQHHHLPPASQLRS